MHNLREVLGQKSIVKMIWQLCFCAFLMQTYQISAKTVFQDVMNAWEEDCGKGKYPDSNAFHLKNFERISEKLIVGGEDARPNEFPWQISMHRLRDGGEFSHSCGGSIINSEWILSAAHCVDTSTPDTLQIIVGAWNITDHENEDSATAFSVAEIEFHPDFDGSTFENDIALLRVDGTIEFSEDVQPICPPPPGYDYSGEQCIVSGWGALNSYIGPAEQIFPDLLQWVSLPITDQQACVDKYAAINSQITDDMVCAGAVNETEKDACQGDSGGPLVCQNSTTSYFHQVGVVSWGFGCANRFPGVYARVSFFLDYIDGIIGA